MKKCIVEQIQPLKALKHFIRVTFRKTEDSKMAKTIRNSHVRNPPNNPGAASSMLACSVESTSDGKMNTQSEVAELRKRIDRELEGISQFRGYAIAANHTVIQARFQSLGHAYDRLSAHLGEDSATQYLVTQYNKKVR